MSREVEELLAQGGVLEDGAEDHLDDAALERAAAGAGLDAAATAHLARCVECRTVLALSAPRPAQAPSRLILAAAAVLALGVGLWLALRPAPVVDAYTHRGETAPLKAQVAVLAIADGGATQDVKDGARVPLDRNLGFVYGNPGGVHKTLTLLGWDGSQVRWYAPEKAGGAPEPVGAHNHARLMFDIDLDHSHAPGPLTLVAAFDADPEAVAKALERGEVPVRATVLKIELVP